MAMFLAIQAWFVTAIRHPQCQWSSDRVLYSWNWEFYPGYQLHTCKKHLVNSYCEVIWVSSKHSRGINNYLQLTFWNRTVGQHSSKWHSLTLVPLYDQYQSCVLPDWTTSNTNGHNHWIESIEYLRWSQKLEQDLRDPKGDSDVPWV